MNLIIILTFCLSGLITGNSDGGKVLICKGTSSYAYHSGNCTGLQQCRAAIEKVTLNEAKRLKRKPCDYCYGTSSFRSNSLYDSGANSSQCRAITKKGTRCSRNAKSSGYCWQHE